jgi:hypothetical protein
MPDQSCTAQAVPVLTPKSEQVFIDRLIEILLMQVEPNENMNNNENQRIHKTI